MANGDEDTGSVFPNVIELNVGGQVYTTALATLTKEPNSLLGIIFSGRSKTPPLRDTRGRYFVDRDGHLFRFILDYLRNSKLTLPEEFQEKDRLQLEADYYRLPGLVESVKKARGNPGGPKLALLTNAVKPSKKSGLASSEVENGISSANNGGYIVVGYRGTFAFGRDGLADVQFRKLNRIIVHGRVSLCREVFKDTLNESRDPDRGGQGDRYTARFFLKHSFLEQAFDALQDAGFNLVTSCASGVSHTSGSDGDNEEARWMHYNEFVFYRTIT